MTAAVDAEIAAPWIESTPTAVRKPRFDPFRVLGRAERKRQLDGYRKFLRQRDGEMCFEAGTLAEREAYFAEFDVGRVESTEKLDLDGFYQHLHKVGKPAVDARVMWLLTIAKANQLESYGVDGEIKKWRSRGYSQEDEIVLYDLLEERYHTRILIEVCRAAGLGSVSLGRPDAFLRSMIRLMQYAPDALRYILVTCGEVMGCVVFETLLEHSHLFSDEPEVRARIESLVQEILLDETGHVLYCRTRLSPLGLRLARMLVPVVAPFLLKDVPELKALGLDNATLVRKMRSGVTIQEGFEFLAADAP